MFTARVFIRSSDLGKGHKFECRTVFERAMRSSSFDSNGTCFVNIEASTKGSLMKTFGRHLWLRGSVGLYLEWVMTTRVLSLLWFYCQFGCFTLLSTMAFA
mmetsp:Transcript_2480/g.16484  ORF Transcript_2480/g.16484 Transcript_2480/m.16484 type:complete len:101 (+) Transcript_2480:750-1052(+)